MFIKNQVKRYLGLNQSLGKEHETYRWTVIIKSHGSVRIHECRICYRLHPTIKIKVLSEESNIPPFLFGQIVTNHPFPNVPQTLPVVYHGLGHLHSSSGNLDHRLTALRRVSICRSGQDTLV